MKFRILASLMLALALSLPCSVARADEAAMLNINTATVEELAKVPCLGESLARAIVEYREEMGDFMSLDELASVPGMDKAKVEEAGQFVRVDAISGSDCNC